MQNSKSAKIMDEIVMRLITQKNHFEKKSHQDSQLTMKDPEIYGTDDQSSLIHSRNHSRKLSIVLNNEIIAEYTIDFLENKKISFTPLPQKKIDDFDSSLEEDISEIEIPQIDDINNESIVTISLNNQAIVEGLTEFYIPVLLALSNSQSFNNNKQSCITAIENYMARQSLFDFEISMDDNQYRTFELITIGFFIFLLQMSLKQYYDFCPKMDEEKINDILNIVRLLMVDLNDNIMLLILVNFNSNKTNDNEVDENQNANGYEELMNEKMIDYFKQRTKPQSEKIPDQLNENMMDMKDNFIKVNDIVINYLYSNVKNLSSNNFNAEFVEEVSYFEKLQSTLKENKSELKFEQIKSHVQRNVDWFLNMVNQSKIKPPFLPPIDGKKFKYTLVVDLDETLVHYIDEEENAYVQVRPYVDYFLSEMGKHFEIVIFTAAAEDYADLVLKELDKDNCIAYKLYRKHTNRKNGIFIKDLSKLGRDINKMCIIDNNKENFALQPQNGLHISSFYGEQSDKELFLLCSDLMEIIQDNRDNILDNLKNIREKMEKRYQGRID